MCAPVSVCAVQDIQGAAIEESLDIKLPPHLNAIEKVRALSGCSVCARDPPWRLCVVVSHAPPI
jgi:hypothetical protein